MRQISGVHFATYRVTCLIKLGPLGTKQMLVCDLHAAQEVIFFSLKEKFDSMHSALFFLIILRAQRCDVALLSLSPSCLTPCLVPLIAVCEKYKCNFWVMRFGKTKPIWIYFCLPISSVQFPRGTRKNSR